MAQEGFRGGRFAMSEPWKPFSFGRLTGATWYSLDYWGRPPDIVALKCLIKKLSFDLEWMEEEERIYGREMVEGDL
jgi:hypothetical protein